LAGDVLLMKIALLGANGQLGTDLMSSALVDAGPEVVINTTAYHKVDLCESHAEDAFGVNAIAVFDMARIANQIGAKLVHISTDYVLSGDGTRPLDESVVPMPESVYASSKLAGETIVRNVAQRHLLIRTCGLYGTAGTSGKGGNFPETILERARSGDPIRVVDDQVVGPTWAADFARQMRVMLDADLEGLVHVTAEGSCSWYEFARWVLDSHGIAAHISPTTSESYNSPAKRPAYSVLDNARLKSLGLNRMMNWKDGLAAYLREKHGVGVLRKRGRSRRGNRSPSPFPGSHE